jgi:hypothetical protein
VLRGVYSCPTQLRSTQLRSRPADSPRMTVARFQIVPEHWILEIDERLTGGVGLELRVGRRGGRLVARWLRCAEGRTASEVPHRDVLRVVLSHVIDVGTRPFVQPIRSM